MNITQEVLRIKNAYIQHGTTNHTNYTNLLSRITNPAEQGESG